MQRHLVLTAAALALAATIHSTAAAQQRPVTVLLGVSTLKSSSIGLLPGTQSAVPGQLLGASAPFVGLQLPTAIRGVDLRLTAQHASPYLAFRTAEGLALQERAGITSLTAEAVVHLPGVAGVRPYLLAGGGLRHYAFDQQSYADHGAAAIPRDATVPLLRVGAGASFKLGPADLFTEATLNSAHYRNQPGLAGARTVATFGYTLGVRIPLGRR